MHQLPDIGCNSTLFTYVTVLSYCIVLLALLNCCVNVMSQCAKPASLQTSAENHFCSFVRLCVQLMSTLQGQAGQDFGMQAFGGMPGERRPNMLASIQTYLDKLQEIMQNPSVLLPSLSYPPGQGLQLLTTTFCSTCITYLQSQMMHDLCTYTMLWKLRQMAVTIPFCC